MSRFLRALRNLWHRPARQASTRAINAWYEAFKQAEAQPNRENLRREAVLWAAMTRQLTGRN